MCEAARELGTSAERTVVVGDTMETDILGGMQLGLTTVLVLSGGTQRSDLSEYAFRPTYTVETIADLLRHKEFDSIFAPGLQNGRAMTPSRLLACRELGVPEMRDSRP